VNRGDVHAAIEAHIPADAKEAADRAAMVQFLASLPEPFSAAQPDAHFTASALVLDESRTRACLVLHRKLGLWLQPGGHIEQDERSLAAAALREVREETGLDALLAAAAPVHLDIHEIPERGELAAHLHLDVRFLVTAAGDELTLSDESTDVRWWAIGDAAVAGDESLARLLAAGVEN
jgi:8-oxo-dGTP pyrophosphatase MutT (NUDIX family)